jgi:4-hydroxymandelate oxidase
LARRDRQSRASSSRKKASPKPKSAGAGRNAISLFDFEELARQRLPQMVYDYIVGGAGDEITLRRNRECFEAIRLKPRVLVDVSRLDTSLELFGQRLAFPILLAPTAYHKLVHPGGELATACGAAAAGATLVVSSFATTSIEDIARSAAGALWFQLYIPADRSLTRDLIQRAEAAGCKALVVTVDTPVLGQREREMRGNFHLPPGMERVNLKGLGQRETELGHFELGGIYTPLLDASLTWKAIDWTCSLAKKPVILKGILSVEDAKLAAEHGAAGVIVSNHGARNLDTTPAAIEALPRVAEAVEGRIPVLMDGGIRRGTDVVKALGLGARAVLIGRPYLWGLAVDGASGVERVVKILFTETQAAMALCGRPTLASIDRSVLWPDR